MPQKAQHLKFYAFSIRRYQNQDIKIVKAYTTCYYCTLEYDNIIWCNKTLDSYSFSLQETDFAIKALSINLKLDLPP